MTVLPGQVPVTERDTRLAVAGPLRPGTPLVPVHLGPWAEVAPALRLSSPVVVLAPPTAVGVLVLEETPDARPAPAPLRRRRKIDGLIVPILLRRRPAPGPGTGRGLSATRSAGPPSVHSGLTGEGRGLAPTRACVRVCTSVERHHFSDSRCPK